MKLIVIDVDTKDDDFWEKFRSFFDEKLELETILGKEHLPNPEVIAVLEDRWGWDFVFHAGDKIYSPDRNAGLTQITTKVDEFIAFLKSEGKVVEDPIWHERCETYS